MSSKNYDVELNITYNNAYRHYIPKYSISVPRYDGSAVTGKAWFQVAVSFDDESEQNLHYVYSGSWDVEPPSVIYNDDPDVSEYGSTIITPVVINAYGIFSKVYFRNPRTEVTFTPSNCRYKVNYISKAPFEVQWLSTGFVANHNAVFKCATVQKNTPGQYEWRSATVYYKKSTASSYASASGTVSGTWSDVRIDTNISLEDGYTYDIYITAVGDDGSTASTPVAQFTTTDTTAVSTCIAPVGAFTQGEVTFIWSHSTEYGTPQYAYDLQYSINNGSSWVVVKSHEVTQSTTTSITLSDAGTYKWRVRTYNSNDVAGEWAEASFVNDVPANPPTNLSINTKGRPTVSWASISQSAYQVQFLLGDTIVYDSGAVYTTQTSHFVNQYFNDERSYRVRLRIYNALGEVSEWIEGGYQQPSVNDVSFEISASDNGGAVISINRSEVFNKYYLLRNNRLIAEITGGAYTDRFAVGLNNYSVVGVTSEDQSDIQTIGFRAIYPRASIITLDGQQIAINKRVNEVYEVQTSNEADINKAKFIGDDYPSHYANNMHIKSFSAVCFDDQGACENLLGQTVFYADDFGNGGYCVVTTYSKTDNFVKNSQGVYANEVSLELEVTNYDDSIKYPL